MDKATLNQLTYKVYYEALYNKNFEVVSSILTEDNYRKIVLSIQAASAVLNKQLDRFTLKREEGSIRADIYTETLFRRFNNFLHRYTEPPIFKFIEKEWPELKMEFAAYEHAIPEHFQFDEEETIKLLAEWRSIVDILDKLDSLDKAIDIDDVLFKLKLELTNAESILKGTAVPVSDDELNVDELSTKQQTLLLNYMLNTFQDKFFNKSARARFIQKMTRKDYTKIKRVLNNPFDNKDESYLIKDFMIVRNEFLKLELNKLADKVKQDIDSLD